MSATVLERSAKGIPLNNTDCVTLKERSVRVKGLSSWQVRCFASQERLAQHDRQSQYIILYWKAA